MAELVEGDKPVRPAYDFPGGAIIQLQSHDLGLGPIVFEAEDVGQFRPAPAVNGLIVVAHHADISMFGSQGFYNPILTAVGVLIFIDQEMIEAVGLGLADFRELGKKIFGANQQVVEIQCPSRFQGVLVAAKGGGGKMFLVGLGQIGGLVGSDAGVFPTTDEIEQVAGRNRASAALISLSTLRATPS